MDERKRSQIFNEHLDERLHGKQPAEPAPTDLPEELRQAISLADRLAQTDFSAESRQRQALRRRWLGKAASQTPARQRKIAFLGGLAAWGRSLAAVAMLAGLVLVLNWTFSSLIHGIHIYKGVDYSQRLKVSELISQTSGLADYEADKPRRGRSVLDELKAGHDLAIDTPQAMEIVRSLSPHFAPGTPGKAFYSNANYRLLGAIIETVTGKSMAANFMERIYSPLGLQHTYLFDCNSQRPAEVPATIYLKDAPAHIPQYLTSNVSDGGLVSTASECITFLRAFFEGRLFDKGLLDQMMRWNPIFFPLRYGWGMMNFRLPRYFSLRPLPEFIGHSGSTGSFAFLCPSRSIYLAGTVNQIATPAKPFLLMSDLVKAAI